MSKKKSNAIPENPRYTNINKLLEQHKHEQVERSGEQQESQYGKGLTICLVKFMEHAMDLSSQVAALKKMQNEHPEMFEGSTEPMAVNMWANAASDHLFDIEVPRGSSWDEIRKKVKELQEKGLNMGHGDGLGQRKYTVEDAHSLIKSAMDIALMVDEKIGLSPDIGNY